MRRNFRCWQGAMGPIPTACGDRIPNVRMRSVLLCACWMAACSAPAPPAGPAIDPAKAIDLSYAYGADTIYWPNAEGFRHRKDTWAMTPGGYWYAAGDFGSAE